MSLVLTRVDARLIHGQVAVRWTKVVAAKRIVVVDDKTAKDEFLSELLMIAKPQGVEVVILGEEDAVARWKEDQFGEGNVFLLFQNIATAKRCHDKGIGFESVNIGQVPKHKDTKRANNTVHLDPTEIAELDALSEAGVRVYFHPTPEDILVEWDTAKRKLR